MIKVLHLSSRSKVGARGGQDHEGSAHVGSTGGGCALDVGMRFGRHTDTYPRTVFQTFLITGRETHSHARTNTYPGTNTRT